MKYHETATLLLHYWVGKNGTALHNCAASWERGGGDGLLHKYTFSWDRRLGKQMLNYSASGCATTLLARKNCCTMTRGRLHDDYCAARWERGGLIALAGFKCCC